jgi:hypothetical protein
VQLRATASPETGASCNQAHHVQAATPIGDTPSCRGFTFYELSAMSILSNGFSRRDDPFLILEQSRWRACG